jgi:hypothetical protein
VGNPDLSREDPRGLVIYPAHRAPAARGEWWLVPLAILLAAALIAIAFAVR